MATSSFLQIRSIRSSEHLTRARQPLSRVAMASQSSLPSPPPLADLLVQAPAALFLDFDGTLVELAPEPGLIDIPETLVGSLHDVRDRLEGRLALVSGRALDDLERHLGDVRPAIASAHVLVLPSHREGLPRSVLEAMAMGRVIITTDAPGCRETVVPGVNGLLVPVADPEALAEAMQSLVDQPDRVTAMGEASLDMARKRFSTSRINQAMLAALSLTGPRS